MPVSTTELLPRYARAANGDALGIVAFGESRGHVSVPLTQLGEQQLLEIWHAPTDEIMFGSLAVDETKPIERVTREAYEQVIENARRAGYPHFLRMWNHVGSLNDVEGGTERYQRFCAGRHDAFAAAGYGDFPAASAVGMPGRGLITYFLAAREPGVQIENPRQVSAYRYPPQYGAKSPSFSRATAWRDVVFVAGTSSVVGHETLHAGDVDAQLDETLRNIDAVLAHAIAGGNLSNVIAAKTYIRHASDYERIASRLEKLFPANLYLQADICRRELLLEIEVVARIKP